MLNNIPVQSYHSKYYSMYSSVFGKIVTDPRWMMVPIDDHLVHRGDGVFETLKCVRGGIYNLGAHFDRLEHSASAIHLPLPVSREELQQLVIETVRVGGHEDCLIRLMISRGPGSLGVNPYDSIGPQTYIVVARLSPPFMEQHPEGARTVTSHTPPKPAFYSGMKSCNYLPNVLMAREARDRRADFAIGFDASGNLGESATENVAVVSADQALEVPCRDSILEGTTMVRVLELAGVLVEEGLLRKITTRNISRTDMRTARELLILGTTRNVIAVTQFDDEQVHDGKPGPVYQRLSELLIADILENDNMRTTVCFR